jgi:enterochelin esterase-like enzyme
MNATSARTLLGWLAVFATAGCALAQEPAAAGAEEVRAVSFHSTALGENLDYLVALPEGYEPLGETRYTVLYLLHGRGDNLRAWAKIAPDLRRLAAEGRIPPVIAIMPDAPGSNRAGYYIDSKFTGSAEPMLPRGAKIETAFTADLVAHVDATYRTRAERGGRVLAGYSMGGYGALRFALAHPELFGAAIVLSPAVYVPLPPKDSSTREFGAFGKGGSAFSDEIYTALNYPALLPVFAAKKLPLAMFIAVGDDEHANSDPAEAQHDLDYEAHTLYNRVRREPLIKAQLRVVDGRHNWTVWQPMLLAGLDYVFAELRAVAPARR